MSRIGQKPVQLPSGVKVAVDGGVVKVKGGKGELSYALPGGLTAKAEEGLVTISRPDDTKDSRRLHGLARSLVANMVKGVSDGFLIGLEIQGVGFKAVSQGAQVVLSLGFSHPVEFPVPDGIKVTVEANGTALTVTGCDKQQVGLVAARLRSYFPAEPYKGKGVRYKGEQVRKKVGKTVA